MFDRILALFDTTPDQTFRLTEQEADLALGALLVRVAKTDGAYLFQEVAEIDLFLAYQHDLTEEEAAAMRDRCEALNDKLPSTLELAGVVQGAIHPEQRETVISGLWRVVFADKLEHPAEQDLVFLASDLLGIDMATCLALRFAEARRLGLPNITDNLADHA